MPAKQTSGEGLQSSLTTQLQAPYVAEGNTFERMLQTERNRAERVVFDLDGDIARMKAEIALLEQRRDDNQLILARIEAALGVDTIEGFALKMEQPESDG